MKIRILVLTIFLATVFSSSSVAGEPYRPLDRITESASTLLGVPVKVTCTSGLRMEGTGGISYHDLVTIELNSVTVCPVLRNTPLVIGRHKTINSTGEAILVLAHEVGHLAGNYDEMNAECWGFQHLKRTALLLGYKRSSLPIIVAQARWATFCNLTHRR